MFKFAKTIFMIISRKNSKKNYSKIYNVNYFNVRNTAWTFLIKNNVTTYPLDLHKIINSHGWKIVSYKKYSQINNKPINELLAISADGFTEIDDKGNYVIAINEQNSEQRNRFTICHEIGHIILHNVFKDYSKLEQEANMFSARILMPMCLLYECNLDTPEKVAKTCNVSLTASSYRLNRFKEVLTRNKIYTNQLEKKLKKQLDQFFETYNTQKE